MSAEVRQTAREVAETLLLESEERGKLLGLARRRYGIPLDAAEDLLQETAVELLQQRQYVQQPRAYLYAVFRFRCFRYLSRQHATRDRPEDAPDASHEEIHQQILVWQALEKVSPSCRRLLAARYLEGQSLREAALTVALAYSGVMKTISRCLQRLRACLA